MTNIIVDNMINQFVAEEKLIPSDFDYNLVPDSRNWSRLFQTEIDGANGHKFHVIFREAIAQPRDFSIILSVIINNNQFRLRRYNGDWHNHTNRIEKNRIVHKHHIHKATERYQMLGMQEEGFAEPTDMYRDLRSAFNFMITENNFRRRAGPRTRRIDEFFPH